MAFRLKLVSGGTTYYVTTLEQTSLNMNAVPPFINVGSLTGLTTDAELATDFTAAQVKEAKMAYPAFVSEAYVAPAQVGILSSPHIFLGQSVNGTSNSIIQHNIVCENITTPTVTITVANESDPVSAYTSVSKLPGGPYVPEIVFDVVDGRVNAEFTTYFHGVAGDELNTCDLVLKDGAGVTLFTAEAAGYHYT